MSTDQAVYDATRSALRNTDVGAAVQEAMTLHLSNLPYAVSLAQEAIATVQREMIRPSVMFRPRLSIDGNMWCALYGENLQEGVAGFGSSPEAACCAFDNAWTMNLK